jgi:hypothetical protein
MNINHTENNDNKQMSKLIESIKLFDIYGSYFNLRINNQAKFKSTIGGIFSIITMAVFLFCVINFGKQFIYKLNPRISVQTSFLPDDKPYVMTGSKYQNKTMIVALQSQFKNILLPVIHNIYEGNLLTIVPNECDQNGLSIMQRYLTTNPDLLDSLTFYCVNLNDYLIGSNSLSQLSFNPKLSVNIRSCQDIDPQVLLAANLTCDNDFFANNTIDSYYVQVYFEKYGFDPDILDPFVSRLSVDMFSLGNNMISEVSIPLQLNTLQDDRGALSSEYTYSSVLNVNDYSRNDYYFDMNYPFLNINFYISEQTTTYMRSYEKFQDLLAVIGGFMKLIFAGLNILNFIIRAYLVDMHIIDTLFRKEEAESEFYQAMRGNLSVDTIKTSKIYINLIHRE